MARSEQNQHPPGALNRPSGKCRRDLPAGALVNRAVHCPRKIFRVVMPSLISTCSVACRPSFSIMME
jgi:hypothetical protein